MFIRIQRLVCVFISSNKLLLSDEPIMYPLKIHRNREVVCGNHHI